MRRAKSRKGEEQHERSGNGHEDYGEDLGAAAFGDPEHEEQAEKRHYGEGRDVRASGDAEDDGEQNDARAPLASRTLHGMGDPDAGVDAAVDAEGGEDLRIGCRRRP